ncbi:MAG TPA: beta-ketoacyl synthase N-terminal-like domain-containing protein, partial [Anaerolineales bacterium]|nr:beta-ketoacyl synthase N-terminal-like domain-containing protein [Anaerolineales bacterium]
MKKTSPLPRAIALVGAGMSKFGAFPDKNSRDLFVEAYKAMRQSVDKGFDPSEIDAVYVGNFSSGLFEGQSHTAPIMADSVGLVPRPAVRVENACASGATALRQGIMAIVSGMADIVLVGGAERMTALPTSRVTDTLAVAGDVEYEIPAGFTFPGFYAAMASAYIHRYGMRPEHLMRVAQKNHDNGALNPNAQFSSTIAGWMESRKAAARRKGKPVPTWQDEMEFFRDDRANPMIAWPLRLFDCSPITDGAACLLIVAGETAHNFTDYPIYITGSGQATDYPLHDRADLTALASARKASQIAYDMAGVTPQDIRIAEVHDCFTIAEVIATE